MSDSALNLLGLCRKAGKLSMGHDAVKASLKYGNASLCVICSDASDRLKEEMLFLAEQSGVDVWNVNYSMLDIRQATGFKASVFTLDDEGFAKSLKQKFSDNKSGEERVYGNKVQNS